MLAAAVWGKYFPDIQRGVEVKLLLLTGDAERPAAEAGLVVHWDRTDVPVGIFPCRLPCTPISLRICAEHAAWAYNMGFSRLAVRIGGQIALRGHAFNVVVDITYERHPKDDARALQHFTNCVALSSCA